MDIDDLTWNPWHGCRKCSEGCQNCYVFFLDRKYGRDASIIARNRSAMDFPVRTDRQGRYKLPGGAFVRVCMTRDFFLEEADAWRDEAWGYIRKRPDVTFSLLTKRAHRIMQCLPDDWGSGWDNVHLAVSAENQARADERVPYLLQVPAAHRWVSIKPFIGAVDLSSYLSTGRIETVLAGGENYGGSRPLRHEWVEQLEGQCAEHGVRLVFGQTGNVFMKDGRTYHIRRRETQMAQALRSGLNYPPADVETGTQKILNKNNK